MEGKKIRQRPKHPKEKANCLSHFFFGWELPLLLKSRNKTYNLDSFYETLEEHRAKDLGEKLDQLWTEEKLRKQPSLTRALWKMVRLDLCFYGIIFLPVDLGIGLLQPFCLRWFLNYFTQNKTTTKADAYIYASGFLLLQFLRIIIFQWMCIQMSSVGIKVKAACCSLIYKKSLTLKRTTLEEFTVGQIVNLLSNDVNRFNELFLLIHYIWSSPIKLVASVFYLYFVLGYTAVFGVAITIILSLIQVFCFKILSKKRMQVAVKTDHRIHLMNDVISGIHTIKMYTWEKPFLKIIQNSRKLELDKIASANSLRICVGTFRYYVNKISIFSCIVGLVLAKMTLTPEYYFPLFNIYENLNASIIQRFHSAAVSLVETRISVFRIQKFLLSENKSSTNLTKHNTKLVPVFQNKTIKFKNVGLNTLLDNVNLEVLPRDFVGIYGPAGSGKSTLLQLILKEIEPSCGSICVEGTVSYSSQEPWIFSASVRQNILFGQEMDEERYTIVLRVCALEHDLNIFSHGDQTLVGERGVMLSGGQKARINLARAVYQDAHFYLLDDPLAAVDAHVAQHIFEECILRFLESKSVVLVTHRVNFLEKATRVYFVDNGTVEKKCINKKIVDSSKKSTQKSVLTKNDSCNQVSERETSVYSTLKLYKKLFNSGKHWTIPFAIILLYLLTSSLDAIINYFVAFETNLNNASTLSFRHKPETFLWIYGSLCILSIIFSNAQIFAFITNFKFLSNSLHNLMLTRILLVPIKFFNENVSGRILNRFSQDIGCIDEVLPHNLDVLLKALFDCFGTVVVISILSYWLIIPSVLLLLVFYSYALFFEPISRNLRHLEAITKSPVFTHLVMTVRGLTTIRASQTGDVLQEEFNNHLDLHSSVYYLFKSFYHTFTFWVDLACFLYTATITYSFLLFDNTMWTSHVGLAICQANTLVGLVQYGMKMWTEVNALMSSVERIVEYQELPPEEDNGTVEIPKWPQFGKIEFKDVSMRYYPDKPLVLKNINLKIESGEKVGIVGRTGAGKTSLVSLLFRLFHFDGKVLIDSVDTKSVPLNLLRSKIFIIPQDPVLFIGTLRKNLDPFEEFNDSQLWNALHSVYLKEMVSKLPLGLETLVLENGTNFSVGQKQLLCLSRAILRNSKIVVFDEATANIDVETDTLIQSTIRSKFKSCTVLTIAHRLDTVMDSNKILVMEDGRAVEFDKPEELLKNKEGVFYNFVYQRNCDLDLL